MTSRQTLLPVLLVLLAAAALPASSSAGTVLTMRSTTPAGTHTSKIYIQGGNLRVDSGEMRNTVISRSATTTMYILNGQDRSYVEMTPKSLAEGRQAILEKLDEREDLSGEEKAAIREQLTAAGQPGSGDSSWSYRKVASGIQVGGFLTDEYEVVAGSRRLEEVWVADPAQLKISANDLSALRELEKRFAGPGAPAGLSFLPGQGAPAGVPVRMVRYERGRRVSSSIIVSATPASLPEALFSVPKDYEKKAMELPQIP